MMKQLLMLALLAQTPLSAAATATDPFTQNKKNMQLSSGITLKYIEAGNPKGKPMLLIHGYSDTSRSFQPLIEELLKQDQNLYILAPDLRGHGGSSMPPINDPRGFTFNAIIEDMVELMGRKGLESVHLAGHSMGSFIAQDLALKFPDKVRTLTLMGSAADCTQNATVQDFLIGELINGWKNELEANYGPTWQSASYFETPKDLGKNVTDFLKEYWVVEVNTPAAYLNAIFQEAIQNPLGTWFGTMAEIGKFNNTERLKELRVPTLILWAEGDELLPKAPDQDILLKIGEFVEAANDVSIYSKGYGKFGNNTKPMGHNFHWGIPAEVAADILGFISDDHGRKPGRTTGIDDLCDGCGETESLKTEDRRKQPVQ